MANYWYDHVHLFSSDPKKAADFYEKMFNAQRIATRQLPDGSISVELRLNESRLLIAQTQKPIGQTGTAGLDHWGIRTDNIESAVANLKANGVKFRDEIREARPGVIIAFFRALDNVLIEILQSSSVT